MATIIFGNRVLEIPDDELRPPPEEFSTLSTDQFDAKWAALVARVAKEGAPLYGGGVGEDPGQALRRCWLPEAARAEAGQPPLRLRPPAPPVFEAPPPSDEPVSGELGAGRSIGGTAPSQAGLAQLDAVIRAVIGPVADAKPEEVVEDPVFEAEPPSDPVFGSEPVFEATDDGDAGDDGPVFEATDDAGDDEDAVTTSETPAAEPWEGYDKLSVKKVMRRVRGDGPPPSTAFVARVRAYEAAHKNRSSLLDGLDSIHAGG